MGFCILDVTVYQVTKKWGDIVNDAGGDGNVAAIPGKKNNINTTISVSILRHRLEYVEDIGDCCCRDKACLVSTEDATTHPQSRFWWSFFCSFREVPGGSPDQSYKTSRCALDGKYSIAG